MAKSLEAMWEQIKQGNENDKKILSELAVISTTQIDMKSYQTKCDKDRLEHDKRITETENYQKNQKKNIAAIVVVLSGLINIIPEFFKK